MRAQGRVVSARSDRGVLRQRRVSEILGGQTHPGLHRRPVSVSDSTVICEYLDDRFPAPRLLPPKPAERARARWLEEFADTRLADVLIWRVFYEAVILFDELSMADVAVAVCFTNLRWARVELDQARWPKTSGWVGRTNATPALAKLNAVGEKLMRVPPDQQRSTLAELGFRLTPSTLATSTARRGPMTVG